MSDHLCSYCGHVIAATGISVWYMHDNHTFTRLFGDVGAIISAARELGRASPYGMLGPLRLLGSNDQAVAVVGDSIHAREGFSESDLAAWQEAVLADAEACRLLAAGANDEVRKLAGDW